MLRSVWLRIDCSSWGTSFIKRVTPSIASPPHPPQQTHTHTHTHTTTHTHTQPHPHTQLSNYGQTMGTCDFPKNAPIILWHLLSQTSSNEWEIINKALQRKTTLGHFRSASWFLNFCLPIMPLRLHTRT